MNLFSKFIHSSFIKRPKPRNILDFTSSLLKQSESNAGGTSFACIDRIASTIAGLSYNIYDKYGEAADYHPLLQVLKDPNLEETHTILFHQIILDYFADGNIYLYKFDDEDGNVTNLFRLNPRQVQITRNDFNQKLFTYNGESYTQEKILHIPSRFGYDGKKGKSVFEVNQSTFDVYNSLDDYTSNSFQNNLGKRLVIDISEMYPNATEEEQRQIRERFLQNYSGSHNTGKPVVKTGKISFSTIDTGVNDNRANELKENRDYQTRVISTIFGVPYEYLTGEGSTDIEKLTTLYATQAISPIVRQLEESFNKLFSTVDRNEYYVKFNYNSLMRTSLSSKIDAYTKQFNNGILSLNEIRAKENLSPIKDGDYHYRLNSLLPINKELDDALGASAKLKQAELDAE